MFLRIEKKLMAEVGGDVSSFEEKNGDHGESNCDNHSNMFRERVRVVYTMMSEFEELLSLLHDASSLLIFPNFQSIVNELVAIVEWLDDCREESFGDERLLQLLEGEREEILTMFGVLYDMFPSLTHQRFNGGKILGNKILFS